MQHLAILEQIKEKALPILKKANIKKASIFGSYVRGDNTSRSDIDILVDFPKGKSLFDFVGLQLDLEDALHKKVDLVTYKGLKARIKDRVLNEQVQIL